MKFTLIIPEKTIAAAYQSVLATAAKTTTVKGYRPGKAPIDKVEANLDTAKLYEQVLRQVFPKIYQDYLVAHDLKPIAAPRIDVQKAQKTGDWELAVEIAQMPKITLGDYQAQVKKALKTPKIWTPDQGKESAKKAPDDSDKLNSIIEALLQAIPVDVPELLIDEEVNQRLSQLIYQLDKLGVNLDSYAASIKKTPDQIKADYQNEAKSSLQLEFIIGAIAKQEKLTVTDKEIDEFISQIDDSTVKNQVTADPQKRQSIAAALTKRQVTDFLMQLVK